MISLDHITLQFGERVLVENATLLVSPHDRIGLVGPNGSGKTTLLRTIAGLHAPDAGEVRKAHYVTTGYLPQEGIATSGRSLYREVEAAFADILDIEASLTEAQESLGRLSPDSPEHAEAMEIVGELQHRLEDLDAFRMKSKIERVLMGLGFATTDFDRQTEEFSGGWQMRIELVKLLLQEPSVLLLDEPTNHLDIDSLEWLESYLQSYNGAVILVSHDRAFLDNLTRRTWALHRSKIEEYAGNYSFFEREHAARRALLDKAAKNQQREIEKTREFIERFRYKATKARQVQSRIKQLEKIELIEAESGEEKVHFTFPPPPPSGRVVMELKEVDKSYGRISVFDGLRCRIERGDRIATLGVNGAGKSTFARILAGIEPIDAGERVVGYNAVVAYFAQHQAEELDPDKEVLQVVEEVATGEVRKNLRTLLGAFLFHGDDVFKRVAVLSGGEKSRLALAKMLLQPANFLIMDEPTNHLDMRSKSVLQEALQGFDGTLLIVSHDRAFLDPVVNKVMEFSHGRIHTYQGMVSEYLERKKVRRETAAASSADTTRGAGISAKERRRIEADLRQERSKQLKPLRERMEFLEKEIERLEHRKKELESLMGTAEFYRRDDAKEQTAEYRNLQDSLERTYTEWEQLGAQLAEPDSKKESGPSRS